MADQEERERDEIARRAYERYVERGREDGRDQEDWFEAERERRNRQSQTGGGMPGEKSADVPERGSERTSRSRQ